MFKSGQGVSVAHSSKGKLKLYNTLTKTKVDLAL